MRLTVTLGPVYDWRELGDWSAALAMRVLLLVMVVSPVVWTLGVLLAKVLPKGVVQVSKG